MDFIFSLVLEHEDLLQDFKGKNTDRSLHLIHILQHLYYLAEKFEDTQGKECIKQHKENKTSNKIVEYKLLTA